MKIAHIIIDMDGVLFDTHGGSCPYPDTWSVIDPLSRTYGFSLVTAGMHHVQWRKLEMCKLLTSFRSVVIVEQPEDKLNAIKAIAHLYAPKNPWGTVVVGDRVDLEIAFANRLGFTAIRVKRGKYAAAEPAHADQKPAHTIVSLEELPQLLLDLQK